MTFDEQIQKIRGKNPQLPSDDNFYYCNYGLLDKENYITRKHANKLVVVILRSIIKDYEIFADKECIRRCRRALRHTDRDYEARPMCYIGNLHMAYNFINYDDKNLIVYYVSNIVPHFLNKVRLTLECVLRYVVAVVAHERKHHYEGHAVRQMYDAEAEKIADEYAMEILKKYDSEIYQHHYSQAKRVAQTIEFLKRI